MHDFKNILLAWLSSSFALFTAIDEKTFITVVSAIVLPIVFFTVGKTIDVLLQICFKNKEDSRSKEKEI